jgi:hypothetical protein
MTWAEILVWSFVSLQPQQGPVCTFKYPRGSILIEVLRPSCPPTVISEVEYEVQEREICIRRRKL